MWNSEHNRLIPKYDIMFSLLPLVKQYNATMKEEDNQFKITCQCCNDFVTCSGMSGELLNITFIHSRISTLGIYPEEFAPEISTFSDLPKLKRNTYTRGF